MYLKHHKFNQGFTLLEMLVAIGIFAMLGLAANSVLNTVMKNDIATKEFATKLKSLQQGFGALERDFGQIVARTPRLLEGGRGSTVIQTGSDLFDSESEAIVFYRIGWLNPDGLLPRGSLQSVAYVVQDNKLERWYFPYPEPEFGAEPIKTLVMDKVLSVEYSFFVENSWQRKIDATTLPKAIAMEVEVEGLGKIQRKFLLPLGAQSSSSSNDADDNDSNKGNDNGANDNDNNADENDNNNAPDRGL